jgi:hypothetical protein
MTDYILFQYLSMIELFRLLLLIGIMMVKWIECYTKLIIDINFNTWLINLYRVYHISIYFYIYQDFRIYQTVYFYQGTIWMNFFK